MSDFVYQIPNDPEVTPSDIKSGADLSGADLSEARLGGADLSGAHLNSVDLSEAIMDEADLSGADLSVDLWEVILNTTNSREVNDNAADLSEAYLLGTDLSDAALPEADLSQACLAFTNLSEADLSSADLSDANLTGANLTDANLYDANLSGANLRDADFSKGNLISANLRGTLLWNTSLSDSSLSRKTSIDPPGQRLEQAAENKEIELLTGDVNLYDAIARTNHELRTAYSNNGLLSRARKARVRERRARRREALADDGLRGTAAWFGSLLSKVFTGYGVQLTWITAVIAALYLVSAGVYHFVGEMSVGRSLYYSVVTFTTSPPETPPAGLTSVVAGIETFAGTAAIVFLGYVLGTRERV